MMVVLRKEGRIIRSSFGALPDYLEKGDLLILNDAKVIPAKAWGTTCGKEVEFLFIKERDKGVWEVLCRPAKKIKTGDRIRFAPGFEGEVIEAGEEGRRVLKFSALDVLSRLRGVGFAPLPPYIKRKKANLDLRSKDLERYQTVFAEKEGAIAAPTAGLHFTPRMLDTIRKKGVHVESVALQVGLATFQPMRVECIKEHKMLEETYVISTRAAKAINQAKCESRPVVAVGTTVVRALESAFRANGEVQPGTNSTSLFIYPGFEFHVVDKLLTNFHLPKSTLLVLVSAFAVRDLILSAYKEAVRERYRFFSYGDCMLII